MSHLTGKRVAILASNGFEESELLEPMRIPAKRETNHVRPLLVVGQPALLDRVAFPHPVVAHGHLSATCMQPAGQRLGGLTS